MVKREIDKTALVMKEDLKKTRKLYFVSLLKKKLTMKYGKVIPALK